MIRNPIGIIFHISFWKLDSEHSDIYMTACEVLEVVKKKKKAAAEKAAFSVELS